jgi:hypothetical protein
MLRNTANLMRRYQRDMVGCLLVEIGGMGLLVMSAAAVFLPAASATQTAQAPLHTTVSLPPLALSPSDSHKATTIIPERPTAIAPSRKGAEQIQNSPNEVPVDPLDRPVERNRIKPSAPLSN